MCFRCTETLAGGCPRTPKRHFRAPCQPARRCPDCAHGPPGHRQPLGHRERAYNRFLGSIIHREGVEFLYRKSETGGTPTLPGVEFVRYRRSCGLGFRQDRPPNAQNCRESRFPGSIRHPAPGPPGRPGTRPRADNDGLAGRDRVPGWRIRRGSRRSDRRPRRGSARPQPRRRGSGGGAPRRPPLLRRAGKPRGQRGAAPRQPPQGTHGVWPQGVSWLVSLT